jgi:hypothetical protein
MTSERRSIEGELPDGIADRDRGYAHNPNPDDEVAANRARFEAKQRELRADHEAALEAFNEINDELDAEYQESMSDPEHQAMIPEQRAHQVADPLHSRGGQEYQGDQDALSAMPTNVEIGRSVPKPTTPRDAEKFTNE